MTIAIMVEMFREKDGCGPTIAASATALASDSDDATDTATTKPPRNETNSVKNVKWRNSVVEFVLMVNFHCSWRFSMNGTELS